jgi:hypothetical protein
MRLSNLQALMLFQTLRDTAVIADAANVFTFDREQRLKLAQDIINQQSKELIELDTKHLVPLQENQTGTAAHGIKNEN